MEKKVVANQLVASTLKPSKLKTSKLKPSKLKASQLKVNKLTENKSAEPKINSTIRLAKLEDINELVALEQACFDHDSLTKRSFKRWIQAPHGIFLVIEGGQGILAYGLVWCSQGTRLARLYSIAVSPSMRGKGLAVELLAKLEAAAAEQGRLFMRLEVAENNKTAIALYQACGYKVFGEYDNYYEDHTDALRMQKTIQTMLGKAKQRLTPWYEQTTDFTCGPAALMMAMASLNKKLPLSQNLELDLWRQATTIFMTSGHGGCHPLGLALAAEQRGYEVITYINTQEPLFLEGVRAQYKKEIMASVHEQFLQQVNKRQAIEIIYQDVTQQIISQWLAQNFAVLALISTYRLDGKKAPHWVTITGEDNLCFYVHDPDLDESNQDAMDCQHLPIAKDDFDKMSAFGGGRLRTAIAIRLKV